ncbi:hypothetical protein BCU62_004775 [Enterovibrio norvegicus]|uniref:Testis-expressed protein 13A/C/D zinc finger domain-containing protein n=1 Tax=Enterovibrio norvegicus TaxID=188144 RepID=A0ABV4L2F0_9GAMM
MYLQQNLLRWKCLSYFFARYRHWACPVCNALFFTDYARNPRRSDAIPYPSSYQLRRQQDLFRHHDIWSTKHGS